MAVPDVTLGDDAYLEPLEVLRAALEDEARLNATGRELTDRFLRRLLEVRRQLVEYAATDPGVRDEVIRAPLFVTGAPRTGTTLLFALLASDTRFRAPEGWELLRPVPPPSPDPDEFARDPRIPLADAELRAMADATGGALDAIHEYGARMPKECLSAMSFEFRSEEFTARYRVPSYVDWLQRCDMRPAYEMHRLVLQVLQRRFDDVHWVLKSPVHLHSLPTLLAVYPDARLVITHRDPGQVLGSVTSLVATLRAAHSNHVDVGEIERYHAELYGRSLDALVTRCERGQLDPDRVHHVRYGDLAADPLGVVRKVYAHFDLPLGADAEARMRAYLDAQPRAAHSYDVVDDGDPRFARYRAYFGV